MPTGTIKTSAKDRRQRFVTIRHAQCARTPARGVTLTELLLALAVAALLAAMAVPALSRYVDRSKITRAAGDIGKISLIISQFDLNHGRLPDSLAEVGLVDMLDPWGSRYEYFNIANATGNGKLRKDRNLVPINTDFDLYSSGKNGRSVGPLTAKDSRDDIIRANNGGFIGLAIDY